MTTFLRALASLFVLALASVNLQAGGLSAGGAAACGFLTGVCTWTAFGLARQVRLCLMAPKDHWRTTPLKQFVLLGIEPAFLAVLAGVIASVMLADSLGVELPEGGADVGR